MSLKNDAMSGRMSVKIGPSLKPSKVTEPMTTAMKTTVPASGSKRVSPDSGRRMPSTPSRRSNADMRANRLK